MKLHRDHWTSGAPLPLLAAVLGGERAMVAKQSLKAVPSPSLRAREYVNEAGTEAEVIADAAAFQDACSQ